MKTILPTLALTLFSIANVSFAADIIKGEAIFTSNCAGCHAGGQNFLAPHKSLSKADLEKNQVNTSAAIIDKVINGQSPMPGFGKLGIISAEDIENVAAYVLKKSEADWK